MADVSPNEDAALRYVLGECSDAERREFEARLATSAELRALVTELEEGATAVAFASPRRRPPAEVWQQVEKAIVRETNAQSPATFWIRWLRNGWAVAAAFLIGWLLYAFLGNRPDVSPIAKVKFSPTQTAIVNSTPEVATQVTVKPLPSSIANHELEQLQARAKEIVELQRKIAQLEMEATQLSRSLARQSALFNESSRIKFYQLTAGSSASWNIADSNAAPMSTDLQRAMLMAVARELGWLPIESKPEADTSDDSHPKRMTIGGIDFVDLPKTNSIAKQPPLQPNVETASTDQSETTIPAFISGDNLVVAMDSTVVPPDSTVDLTVTDANQNQTGGTLVFENNPMVVTIPLYHLIPTEDGFLAIGVNSISSSGIAFTNHFFVPINP